MNDSVVLCRRLLPSYTFKISPQSFRSHHKARSCQKHCSVNAFLNNQFNNFCRFYNYMLLKILYETQMIHKQKLNLNHNLAIKFFISSLLTDHSIFCEILVQRPISRSGLRLPSRMSADDINYMKNMAQNHFDQIMEVLKDMPRPMLLLIRYLDMLESSCKFCIKLFNIDKHYFNVGC